MSRERDNETKFDWWRYTATAAVTAVTLMATAYFAGAKDWVTEEQALEIVKSQSPYNTERSRIDVQIQTMQESNKELAQAVDELAKAVIRLQVYLEREMKNE